MFSLPRHPEPRGTFDIILIAPSLSVGSIGSFGPENNTQYVCHCEVQYENKLLVIDTLSEDNSKNLLLLQLATFYCPLIFFCNLSTDNNYLVSFVYCLRTSFKIIACSISLMYRSTDVSFCCLAFGQRGN